ncbi:RNA-binding protein pop5 [Coniosporium tulheliwenetii]|uniref:RNA-binding protein pop5 n=1 Tax=Coniosporium tulheliwenetii TaxID=3383036 RepID=A0ACC2Z9Y7_9PEZI|nr:RNA-binding protein pop5 [Cladosporium sp. JES 115]
MVRLKNRYLLINILYPTSSPATSVPDALKFYQPTSDKLTPQLLLRLVRDGVAELFGDYGAGMIGGSLQAIIRVTRSHYRLVWAALSFVTKLPRPLDTPCVIHVVRVSGTIRKAEEEAIRRARESVLRVRLGMGGEAQGLLKEVGTAGDGRGRGVD